jgi:hypothetical protein
MFKVNQKIKYREGAGVPTPLNHKPDRVYNVHYVENNGKAAYIGRVGESDFNGGQKPSDPEAAKKYQWIIRLEHAVIEETNPIKNMNLVQKFKLMTKSEPEKSFIEKGIMDENEALTEDGKTLFTAYLLQRFKAEFKTDVVDKIELDK